MLFAMVNLASPPILKLLLLLAFSKFFEVIVFIKGIIETGDFDFPKGLSKIRSP
jgi:hypothetical protein